MAQGSAASILAAANSGAVRGNRGYSAPGTLARHKPWGICINLSWLCLGYIIGVCVTMYMSFKAYTPAWIDQPVGQRSSALPQTLSEHRKGLASETLIVRQEAAQDVRTSLDSDSGDVARVAAAPDSVAILDSVVKATDIGGEAQHEQGAVAEAGLQTDSETDAANAAATKSSTDGNTDQEAAAQPPPEAPTPSPGSKEEDFDADKVKEEAARLSKLAYEETIAKYPEVEFDPPSGPVPKFVPAVLDGDVIPDKYHVVAVGDCQIYQGWQFLANYNEYKKLKKAYPDSPMGGYTRLIHCDKPDSLMHLVPSFRVNSLPWEITKGYPPQQRSWAFVQWLMRYPVREQYILSVDPDTLFVVPPPLLATPDTIFAYPYHYINCQNPDIRPMCEVPEFNPNGVPVDQVPPIGGAPLIISTKMMQEAAPGWDSLMRTIHADEEATKVFNWVLDMYAFALTVAKPDVKNVRLNRCLMQHPPWDRDIVIDTADMGDKENCQMGGDERFVDVPIIHYTHAQPLGEDGSKVDIEGAFWNWDKRRHKAHYPTVPFDPPPEGAPETIKQIVMRINEAATTPEFADFWRAHTDLSEE